MTTKRAKEIPTIDVNLVVVKVSEAESFALDTASKIAVEPQIETQEAVKLVVKGVLKAQKGETKTLTGHKIILTDNVFLPEVAKILQGGTITYDSVETTKIASYAPPVAGSADKGSEFDLEAYSAVYNAAGTIVEYEKITYPNCKGEPIPLNSEDNVFRQPEYTITSAPNTGEAPYTITYVKTLPVIS